MRVQILDTAEEDFVEGFWFYERQQPGLRAYFRNSIYADLRALEESAGAHRIVYRTIIARWLRGFLLRCIIPPQNKQRLYARSWIAAATQRGSQNTCNKVRFGYTRNRQQAARLRLSAQRRSHSRHKPKPTSLTLRSVFL